MHAKLLEQCLAGIKSSGILVIIIKWMGRVNIPHPFNASTSWYLRLGNEPSLLAHKGAAEPHLYLGNMHLRNPDLFLTPAESWGPNSM